MPLVKKIDSNDCTILVWKTTENEAFYFDKIGHQLENDLGYSKIRNKVKRKEFLASRMVLSILLEDIGCGIADIVKDNFGKLLVSCAPDSHISISHSKEYAAAILANRSCGIDVEGKFDLAYKLREKFLSQHEMALATPNTKMAAAFWSAKEALYKADGKKGLIFHKDLTLRSDALEYNRANLFQLKKKDVLVNNLVEEDYLLSWCVC